MEYGLWINGRWQAGSGTVDVENPATGKTVAQVATAGEQEVNAAVAAAKAAFDDGRWSKATPGERSGVLWKMADIIEARADELAKIETEDTGKPYEFISKGADLPFVVDNLRFFATAARDTGFGAASCRAHTHSCCQGSLAHPPSATVTTSAHRLLRNFMMFASLPAIRRASQRSPSHND